MDIFICWSGKASEVMAAGLHDWLPHVLQNAVPFYSGEDIRSGERWNEVINSKLEKTNFAILCLNAQNLDAPWIHFEAGAISKNLGLSRITAILLDINHSDVKRPLGQFQHVAASKVGLKRLVTDVNAAMGEQAIKVEVLDEAFEYLWPKFEKIIDAAKQALVEEGKGHPAPAARTAADKMDEILSTIRDYQLKLDGPNLTLPNHFPMQATASGRSVTLGELLVTKIFGSSPLSQQSPTTLEINTDTPLTLKTADKA